MAFDVVFTWDVTLGNLLVAATGTLFFLLASFFMHAIDKRITRIETRLDLMMDHVIDCPIASGRTPEAERRLPTSTVS